MIKEENKSGKRDKLTVSRISSPARALRVSYPSSFPSLFERGTSTEREREREERVCARVASAHHVAYKRRDHGYIMQTVWGPSLGHKFNLVCYIGGG